MIKTNKESYFFFKYIAGIFLETLAYTYSAMRYTY